jgi:hypothetical protein
MKHLIIFENFDQKSHLIEQKMNKLQSLIPSDDFIFKYTIKSKVKDSNENNHLEIVLNTDTTHQWNMDIERPFLSYRTQDDSYDIRLSSIEEGLSKIEKDFRELFGLSEARKKSERYKGRKIPGKYLTGPHPGKMKKEIDQFRGKSTYKQEWDADYKSGKGGVGKRVKTKKSKATQAYHRMYGDK